MPSETVVSSSHSATVSLHPVEAKLGAAEYYRIWCAAEDFPLNEYHCIEFCGWLVGWGDATLCQPVERFPLRGGGTVATRVEVDIFLTNEGKLVSAVELLGDEPREFASSPPDLWVTFLGRHDDLAGLGLWLGALERHCGRDDCWNAVTEALRQAGQALEAIPNGGQGRATAGRRRKRRTTR